MFYWAYSYLPRLSHVVWDSIKAGQWVSDVWEQVCSYSVLFTDARTAGVTRARQSSEFVFIEKGRAAAAKGENEAD